MLAVLLAVLGVAIGFGVSTVITKQKAGSAEAKAQKELQKAKKEADKMIVEAREESSKATVS